MGAGNNFIGRGIYLVFIGLLRRRRGGSYLSSVEPSEATLFERSENCVLPQAVAEFTVCGRGANVHFYK